MRNAVKLYAVIEAAFGRRALWRIGRFLYAGARREIENNPHTNGEYMLQSWLLAACERAGDKEIVIFDVGANVGDWSFSLLQRLASMPSLSVRIFAFEPAPAQWSTLVDRLEQGSGRNRVKCLNEALSDSVGSGRMHVTGADTGTSDLLFGSGGLAVAGSIAVGVTTIDAAMKRDGIDRIAFLKIDVEGRDPDVIRGARSAMARAAIDVIQFEYNWRWLNFNHTMKSLFDLIKPTGYTLGRLSQHEIELYEDWHPELDRFIETNFVLLGPRFKDALPARRYRFDASNIAVRKG